MPIVLAVVLAVVLAIELESGGLEVGKRGCGSGVMEVV
jgi:hypothetical protein